MQSAEDPIFDHFFDMSFPFWKTIQGKDYLSLLAMVTLLSAGYLFAIFISSLYVFREFWL